MADTLEDFRREQEAEYGTFTANQPIDIDGVRAYNVGDPVPATNVKAHGYDKAGFVDKAPSTRKEG